MRRLRFALLAFAALIALGGCGDDAQSEPEQEVPEPPTVEQWEPFEVVRFSLDPAIDGEDAIGFTGVLDVEEGTRCLTLVIDDGTPDGLRRVVAIPREIDISVESDGAITGSFGVLRPGDTVIFGVSAVGGLAPGETISCDANASEVLWTSPTGWGRRLDTATEGSVGDG